MNRVWVYCPMSTFTKGFVDGRATLIGQVGCQSISGESSDWLAIDPSRSPALHSYCCYACQTFAPCTSITMEETRDFLNKCNLQRHRTTLKAHIWSLASYICPLSTTVAFSALNKTVHELFKQKSKVRVVFDGSSRLVRMKRAGDKTSITF